LVTKIAKIFTKNEGGVGKLGYLGENGSADIGRILKRAALGDGFEERKELKSKMDTE